LKRRNDEMNETITKNRKIALTGAFGALVVVLGITRLGFISLSPAVSLTIMHIPVLLTVMLAGFGSGISVGAVFGIFSLIQAAMSPSGALDPLFKNPLISVLPRMLFAAAAWLIWRGLRKISLLPESVSAAITGFISTLLHTCLVIGSLYLVYNTDVSSAMGNIGYLAGLIVLMPNALIEAAVAAVVCAAVIGSVSVVSGKKSRLRMEDETNQ
jgi:uncharacterized membrane protein